MAHSHPFAAPLYCQTGDVFHWFLLYFHFYECSQCNWAEMDFVGVASGLFDGAHTCNVMVHEQIKAWSNQGVLSNSRINI